MYSAGLRCPPQTRMPLAREDARVNISVVIPVHNGAGNLPRCLSSLAASTRRPHEVIVVDDASTDGTAMVAELSGARLLRIDPPGHGPAAARNRGAQSARGDVIAFIDADTAVHADALALAERALAADSQLAACFGSCDRVPAVKTPLATYRNLLRHYSRQAAREETRTFWAGCGVVRKRDFLAAGGFDETYRQPSIEDAELAGRLLAMGKKIRLLKDMQTTDLKRWTLRDLVVTDVFRRALPCTRLLVRTRHAPVDPTGAWRQALSVCAAWTAVAGCLLAPVDLRCLLAAPLGVLAVGLLNIGFFRLLVRCGTRVTLVGLPLQVLHHLCVGAGFGLGLAAGVADLAGGRKRPAVLAVTVSVLCGIGRATTSLAAADAGAPGAAALTVPADALPPNRVRSPQIAVHAGCLWLVGGRDTPTERDVRIYDFRKEAWSSLTTPRLARPPATPPQPPLEPSRCRP